MKTLGCHGMTRKATCPASFRLAGARRLCPPHSTHSWAQTEIPFLIFPITPPPGSRPAPHYRVFSLPGACSTAFPEQSLKNAISWEIWLFFFFLIKTALCGQTRMGVANLNEVNLVSLPQDFPQLLISWSAFGILVFGFRGADLALIFQGRSHFTE